MSRLKSTLVRFLDRWPALLPLGSARLGAAVQLHYNGRTQLLQLLQRTCGRTCQRPHVFCCLATGYTPPHACVNLSPDSDPA